MSGHVFFSSVPKRDGNKSNWSNWSPSHRKLSMFKFFTLKKDGGMKLLKSKKVTKTIVDQNVRCCATASPRSCDGSQMLITCGGNIKLWNLTKSGLETKEDGSGGFSKRMKGKSQTLHGEEQILSCSMERQFFLVGRENGSVDLWRPFERIPPLARKIGVFKMKGAITDLFLIDENYFLSTHHFVAKELTLFNMKKRRVVEGKSFRYSIRSSCYSSGTIAVSQQDEIETYELQTLISGNAQPELKFKSPFDSALTKIIFSSYDPSILFCGDIEGNIFSFDIRKPDACLWASKVHSEYVRDIMECGDGTVVSRSKKEFVSSVVTSKLSIVQKMPMKRIIICSCVILPSNLWNQKQVKLDEFERVRHVWKFIVKKDVFVVRVKMLFLSDCGKGVEIMKKSEMKVFRWLWNST